jgi:hypothetical protein
MPMPACFSFCEWKRAANFSGVKIIKAKHAKAAKHLHWNLSHHQKLDMKQATAAGGAGLGLRQIMDDTIKSWRRVSINFLRSVHAQNNFVTEPIAEAIDGQGKEN